MQKLSHNGLFRVGFVPLVAAVLGIAATVSLGQWQTRRGDAKALLQTRISEAMHAPLRDLASLSFSESVAPDLAPDSTLSYAPVHLSGKWLPADTVYLDNRPYDGRPGLYVLMAFVLNDGRHVIVNRGWLQRDPGKRDHILPYPTPLATVELNGIVLPDEPRFLELGRAAPGAMGTIWQNLDFERFSVAAGIPIAHFVVREEGEPRLSGASSVDAAGDGLVRDWPYQGQVLEAQIDRHRGYAVQWYSMALAILCLLLFYGFRNARIYRRP